MKRAFTLIELLIVIAILAILAGAMIPMFNVTRQDAIHGKVNAEICVIKDAAMIMHHDTGRWPPASNIGTGLLTDPGAGYPDWDGPYVDNWGQDPWGSNYEIYNIGNVQHVRSCGPNMTCPAIGPDADDIDLIITSDITN